MSDYLAFYDSNGYHYVRREGILYAFTVDEPDPTASLVNQRRWYLTLEYASGRSLTFVFHREATRNNVRDLLVPPATVECV